MAFPYLFESKFEEGVIAPWDTETDTENRLDVVHYSTLALISGIGNPAPHRGAFCLRAQLANDGSPADAFLTEATSFDTAADGTIHIRFAFFLSPDTIMADTNEFVIFQLQSAGAVGEVTAVINYTTATGFRVGVGETAGTAFRPLTLGKWHQLELHCEIDAGGGNDGSITWYLDGYAGTAVTGLDQAAITDAVFGVLGQDAGTTAGTLLLDDLVADETRIYPITDRYPNQVRLTKSGHVFVGKGALENLTLNSGADVNSIARVYDTDNGNTNDETNLVLELTNVAADETMDPAGVPVYEFKRGCYVQLSPDGTANQPRATAKILRANCRSDGTVRGHGQRRKANPFLG